MPDLKISVALKSDLGNILDLQRKAYMSEARLYNDFSIPPLTQSLEEIEKEFEDHIFLKLARDGLVLGSVRASETDGVCHISKLFVDPALQNRGYGARLLMEIEAKFDKAEMYELFTGDKSAKNLYLYRKNGYLVVRRQRISTVLTLVFLNKPNKLRTAGHPGQSQ